MELTKGPVLSAAVPSSCVTPRHLSQGLRGRWEFCWVTVCVICPFSTTGTAVHFAGPGLGSKRGNRSHEWRQSASAHLVRAPGVLLQLMCSYAISRAQLGSGAQ